MLDLATENRIVHKSGAWFTYGDLKLGQGRDKSRTYLEENPQLAQELRQKVLDASNSGSLRGSRNGVAVVDGADD